MNPPLLLALLLVCLAACGDDTAATDSTPADDAAAMTGDATPAASSEAAQTCYDESPSEASCKDCCDCQAALSCSDRIGCRDTCITLGDDHFDARADEPAYEPASELGQDGDFSVCLAEATERDCKACCECDAGLLCGDFSHCRDACGDHSF
jgi:hypothetical protein